VKGDGNREDLARLALRCRATNSLRSVVRERSGCLAKHHLRPAGQPGGNRAKIIASGNRNTRQVRRQRFLISGERALPPVR
jgi:hypothetical protein